MADIDPAAKYRDPMVHDLNHRVRVLEAAKSEQDVDLAVMKRDVTYVKQSVDGISKGINRIMWAIGLAVITAATTFVLSGGLVN